jgi:anti-sigma regulatory factor (Ser/Thr protein kinase)
METILNADTGLHSDFVTTQQRSFAIDEISGVASVRREALKLAAWIGFDETALGRVGVIVSEAATNIVKHARNGEILLRLVGGNRAVPVASESAGTVGLEIVALDNGPGIADVEAYMRDGVSTAGTAGSGLGALRRLANRLEVYSYPGKGSVFSMTVYAQAPALDPEIRERQRLLDPDSDETLAIGAISIPQPGEEICGDAWFLAPRPNGAMLAVADGLGHGPDAAKAARAALSALSENSGSQPVALLELAHERARSTRGAAVAIVALDFASQLLRCSSAGNIFSCVQGDGPRRALLSMNGIVGHRMQKIREISEAWPAGSLLIMHSDGIGTQWDLRNYPGLATSHPGLIAAVLYRDFVRRTDDATVVVVRRPPLDGAM